jgi:hypothetical protein
MDESFLLSGTVKSGMSGYPSRPKTDGCSNGGGDDPSY